MRGVMRYLVSFPIVRIQIPGRLFPKRIVAKSGADAPSYFLKARFE